MLRITLLATATALLVVPVFAQDTKMTLGEGEAVLVGPDGTLNKRTTKVSDAEHTGALAKGANEISRGTAFYRHGGKLYSVSCVGPYIGDWLRGSPGQENMC